MKHLIAGLLSLIATGAVAEGAPTFEDMLAAGDFAAVSSHLAEVHSAHVAGELEASAVRDPFSKFSSTAPQIGPMIEAWVAASPDDPYAHGAATWYYHGRAWRMRGEDTYYYTWGPALEGFNANLMTSYEHAQLAFDLAPDLIAATDALLVHDMVMDQLGHFGVYALVERVMATTPNRGTLYRAAQAFRPNWGGDITRVNKMCEDNAHLVTSVPNYTPEACIADMVLSSGVRGPMKDQAIATLDQHGWDGFEHHRRALYANSVATFVSGVTHEDIADYLQQDGVYDFALARRFYNNQFNLYPRPENDQRVDATRIILHNKDIARAALVSDPGNAAILNMVLFQTETATDRAAHPDRLEVIALWGEVLREAPYNPQYWFNVGAALSENTQFGYRQGGLAAFGNVIAYSNHKPDRIGLVMRNLIPYNMPRTDVAGFDQAEFDAAIACPAVRLVRLLDAVCEANPNAFRCNMRTDLAQQAAPIVEDATTRGVCEVERTAPLGEIAFYPTALDVGDYAHDVDP